MFTNWYAFCFKVATFPWMFWQDFWTTVYAIKRTRKNWLIWAEAYDKNPGAPMPGTAAFDKMLDKHKL